MHLREQFKYFNVQISASLNLSAYAASNADGKLQSDWILAHKKSLRCFMSHTQKY